MAGNGSSTTSTGLSDRTTRVLFHGALLVAFSAASAALLVWPNWAAADGGRTAYEIIRDRETALTDRLDLARALSEHLRDWKQDSRKVFLEEELPQYPALVRQAADAAGARVDGVELSRRALNRWRPLRIPSAAIDGAEEDAGEEIQPRSVHLVLRGSFDSVYRAVGTLSQQQQLFIPDRWDIAAAATRGGRDLRADLWATIFVVHSASEPPIPPAAAAPMGPPAPASRASVTVSPAGAKAPESPGPAANAAAPLEARR